MMPTLSQVPHSTRKLALCLIRSWRVSSRVFAPTSQRERELVSVGDFQRFVQPRHDCCCEGVSCSLTQSQVGHGEVEAHPRRSVQEQV